MRWVVHGARFAWRLGGVQDNTASLEYVVPLNISLPLLENYTDGVADVWFQSIGCISTESGTFSTRLRKPSSSTRRCQTSQTHCHHFRVNGHDTKRTLCHIVGPSHRLPHRECTEVGRSNISGFNVLALTSPDFLYFYVVV